MVYKIKLSLYIIVLLLFVSCGQKQTAQNEAESDLVTLNFVQLNDVYEIAPLGGGLYGGMARVAHVVD